MKTAKKIFSLLLVAVLMLSALPFQADATTTPTVIFLHNDGTTELARIPVGSNGLLTASAPAINQVTDSYATMEIDYWNIANPSGTVVNSNNVASVNFNNLADSFHNGFLWATPVLKAKTHVCDFSGDPVVVAPTCIATGTKTYYCKNTDVPTADGNACAPKVETLAKIDHVLSWSVTTQPTLDAPGIETGVCGTPNCTYSETREIGRATQAITFRYKEAQGGEVFRVENYGRNEIKAIPNGKNVPEYEFVGWYDEAYHKLGDSTHGWNCGHTTFYAQYEENPNNDNMSQITVKARIYKNGVDQKYDRVLLPAEYVVDGTRILDYLDAKESEILSAVKSINEEYKWDGYYYNDDLKTTLTGQEKVNGAKTILIKVDVNPSNLVRVIVYRHDKVSTAAVPAYPVEGFTAGETVGISDVQTAIKNATGRTYSISTIYTDSEWTQLLGGQKVTGDTRKIVPETDTFVLHVVSTSYTGSSNSGKPASNPSTGDYTMIETTAAVMVLAAAAVVALTQLRKRKMI